ncbi:preprotein translocase subunit SecG [Flavobacterium beibuense]|uniref:Protein-export membrane protein SecG n=1 Tax=Flavobacterium beibuense TaxID=657326 RepID=A0A444W7X0_9FLAO|nr:preprotein translocase subunit SecG [Flavobacterium beibuense]RYJ41997.1 Preprotein translocase SecG subunit [Flavobacterium beibuense]
MFDFSIFLVLIVIVSFLLVVVIMVQNPKGGGLSSSLGGTQMMGGVQKTTDFLDKSTWTLATALVILILLSTLSFGSNSATQDSLIDESTLPAPAATTVPATENATPEAPANSATPAPAEEGAQQ